MKDYFLFFAWLISLLGVSLGFTAGVNELSKRQEESKSVKVVYKEPTDEQLAAFWFGDGDKAALRKRICK